MLHFELLHPQMSQEALGFIPSFADVNNPEDAVTQLHRAYLHGGGWHDINEFKHLGDYVLEYPGDPIYQPLAKATLRDETIVLYQGAFIAVFQPDGNFRASRMD